MSTKPKRKPKSRAPAPTRKRKTVRKRAVPERKPEEKAARPPLEKKAVEAAPEKTFTLAIRLGGLVATPSFIEDTLRTLRLDRKFTAVLLEKNPSLAGTLLKAKDYVTWGEVNNKMLAVLLKERGRLTSGVPLTDSYIKDSFGETSVDRLVTAVARGRIQLGELWRKGVRPVFRLHPPSGGFNYSIKRPFASRGELGYRGPQISDLVARMI
jgi:large subunit ribosomal protein L30